MAAPDRARIASFVAVLAAAAFVLHAVARIADLSPVALAPAYMFSPLVAGLVVSRRAGIPLRTLDVRVGRPRWLVAAALVGLPLVGLTLAIAVAVPGVGFDPAADPVPGLDLPPGLPGLLATLGIVLGAGVTVNAVFALGEEVGWRGYLLWELAPLGFWRASIATGVLWGVWHAPVIVAGYNYPSFPAAGIAAMAVACVAYSPVYTYVVLRAESVLAAALLHGVFNGSAGLVLVYATADDTVVRELVASPVGAAGVLAFGVAWLAIALGGTPRLTRKFATQDR